MSQTLQTRTVEIPAAEYKLLVEAEGDLKALELVFVEMGFHRLNWPKPDGFSKMPLRGKLMAFMRFLAPLADDYDAYLAGQPICISNAIQGVRECSLGPARQHRMAVLDASKVPHERDAAGRIARRVSEHAGEIVRLANRSPAKSITVADYCKASGISYTAAQSRLYRLCEAGVLSRLPSVPGAGRSQPTRYGAAEKKAAGAA